MPSNSPGRWFMILLLAGGLGFAGNQIIWGKKQVTHNWPPQIGKEYPDLEVIDQDNKKWKLSSLKDQVIIVETIGMNCPACQSWSGAHIKGPYGNIQPQQDLKDFNSYFETYTSGLKLTADGITMVQLILYDLKMNQPQPKDAKGWAKHFGFRTRNGQYVVVPTQDIRNQASYDLIPGFQLIDKNLILRSDSTGHNPRDNLYTKLLPMAPEILFEGRSSS